MYQHERHKFIKIFVGKAIQIISMRVKCGKSNDDNIKVKFKCQ